MYDVDPLQLTRLQVALNEQFMVAGLHPHEEIGGKQHHKIETNNRVLQVLMARRGSSMTFGENMIFMLNRASKKVPGAMCVAFSPADQAGVRKTSVCNCWC